MKYKNILTITFIITTIIPAPALAYIFSESEAVSDSGDNIVLPGQTVKTGDARASVYTEVIKNSSGTSIIHIKVESNGNKYEEIYSTSSDRTSISATATSGGIKVNKSRPNKSHIQQTKEIYSPSNPNFKYDTTNPTFSNQNQTFLEKTPKWISNVLRLFPLPLFK